MYIHQYTYMFNSILFNGYLHISTLSQFHTTYSNLLKPAGIQLRPATFKMKIYRAEDIPRSLYIHTYKSICLQTHIHTRTYNNRCSNYYNNASLYISSG